MSMIEFSIPLSLFCFKRVILLIPLHNNITRSQEMTHLNSMEIQKNNESCPRLTQRSPLFTHSPQRRSSASSAATCSGAPPTTAWCPSRRSCGGRTRSSSCTTTPWRRQRRRSWSGCPCPAWKPPWSTLSPLTRSASHWLEWEKREYTTFR